MIPRRAVSSRTHSSKSPTLGNVQATLTLDDREEQKGEPVVKPELTFQEVVVGDKIGVNAINLNEEVRPATRPQWHDQYKNAENYVDILTDTYLHDKQTLDEACNKRCLERNPNEYQTNSVQKQLSAVKHKPCREKCNADKCSKAKEMFESQSLTGEHNEERYDVSDDNEDDWEMVDEQSLQAEMDQFAIEQQHLRRTFVEHEEVNATTTHVILDESKIDRTNDTIDHLNAAVEGAEGGCDTDKPSLYTEVSHKQLDIEIATLGEPENESHSNSLTNKHDTHAHIKQVKRESDDHHKQIQSIKLRANFYENFEPEPEHLPEINCNPERHHRDTKVHEIDVPVTKDFLISQVCENNDDVWDNEADNFEHEQIPESDELRGVKHGLSNYPPQMDYKDTCRPKFISVNRNFHPSYISDIYALDDSQIEYLNAIASAEYIRKPCGENVHALTQQGDIVDSTTIKRVQKEPNNLLTTNVANSRLVEPSEPPKYTYVELNDNTGLETVNNRKDDDNVRSIEHDVDKVSVSCLVNGYSDLGQVGEHEPFVKRSQIILPQDIMCETYVEQRPIIWGWCIPYFCCIRDTTMPSDTP